MDSSAATSRPYAAWMETCDGLHEFEVAALSPDLPWPGMVRFEFTYGDTVVGGTMTVDDARELASHISCAAQWASWETRKARAAK